MQDTGTAVPDTQQNVALSRNCLVCSSPAFELVVARVNGSRYSILRCTECGLQYLDPVPSQEELKQIYTARYYRAWGMENGETSAVAVMKKHTFALRLKELEKVVERGPILDVGTASGFFLEVAQSRGFAPYGVEISEYSGKLAVEKFGVDHIHLGTLETAPFPKKSFRAIAMSDLLEHVPDPLATLRLAREFLEEGGVLQIVTPDTDAFSRKCMGSTWTQYKAEHLSYWNAHVLRLAAKEAGYRVLSVRRAQKVMTLRFLNAQLAVYSHSVLTPLIRIGQTALRPLQDYHFRVSMGEMAALLQKA